MLHDKLATAYSGLHLKQVSDMAAEQLEKLNGSLPRDFVPTTVAKTILTRVQIVHDRRRIGIFAGPPGIGKSTAVNAFICKNPSRSAVVTVKKEKATSRLVMQHVVEAIRQLSGHNIGGYIYPETFGVTQQIRKELDILFASTPEAEPKLTLIFDEAQTLSRSAIEELRYWNDASHDICAFPIGLVFVGNQEFSLRADASGQSVISAAVADRGRFIESFDYSDLSNADMAMFIRARGIADPEAVALIVRHFASLRAVRSLRRVIDLLDDLADEAGGEPITAEIVRSIV